jgi:chemotaxis protein histidine kinase CheA
MLNKIVSEISKKTILECSKLYNFSYEEALITLNLSNLLITYEKKPKKKEKKMKASFPLPFNGEIKEECCVGLRHNNGLYTQCQLEKKNENGYCKSCQQLADNSENGIPEYGKISDRLSCGIFEYVDPKGRKPVSYLKVMKKYKLTKEQVLEEALKLNINILEGHFESTVMETKRGRPASMKAPKEPKGSKGRPKKAKKVLEIEGEEEDLFASLVADANQLEEEVEELVFAPKESNKKAEKDAEKEAKLLAEKEAKLLAEKEAKLAAKELEKKQKEEQRLQEKAEKEAKLAADKLAKEAKLAADKLAKEQEKAEKEAKLAADKLAKEQAKEAEKLAKEQEKKEKDGKKKKVVQVEVQEDDEPDVVKKIEYEGSKYLKSKKTGIIYDYTEYVKNNEQKVIGKWNESKNKIDFDESNEESEEEYEE